MTEEEALNLAISSWPKNITPVVHYSESKSIHEKNNQINFTENSLISPTSDYSLHKKYSEDLYFKRIDPKELNIVPPVNVDLKKSSALPLSLIHI